MDNRSLRIEQRRVLHRISRRYTLMLSALVGVLAGFLAVLFRLLIQGTEHLRTLQSTH